MVVRGMPKKRIRKGGYGMNLVAKYISANNIKATNLFSKNEWIPPQSEIKPEQLNVIDVDFGGIETMTLQDALEEMAKPKISYVCKNCNGHINPKTLKCEYCDTQY